MVASAALTGTAIVPLGGDRKVRIVVGHSSLKGYYTVVAAPCFSGAPPKHEVAVCNIPSEVQRFLFFFVCRLFFQYILKKYIAQILLLYSVYSEVFYCGYETFGYENTVSIIRCNISGLGLSTFAGVVESWSQIACVHTHMHQL